MMSCYIQNPRNLLPRLHFPIDTCWPGSLISSTSWCFITRRTMIYWFTLCRRMLWSLANTNCATLLPEQMSKGSLDYSLEWHYFPALLSPGDKWFPASFSLICAAAAEAFLWNANPAPSCSGLSAFPKASLPFLSDTQEARCSSPQLSTLGLTEPHPSQLLRTSPAPQTH